MHIINPYMFVTAPATHYLIENFNGAVLNADWDGSGATFSFFGREFITWAGKTNVTEAANSKLTKSGGSVAWDAGAYSTQQVASGAIKVGTTITNDGSGGGVLIGISNVTDAQSSVDDTTVDFCMVAFSGTLYRQENGSAVSLATSYALDDVVEVEVTSGGDVLYIKNGTVLYTHVAPTINYPLCADCSLRGTSSVLNNCIIESPGISDSSIAMTAGSIVSVRNDLIFTFANEITIHNVPSGGEWFLVVGDLATNVYSIQVRYVTSIGRVRLTQHYGGVDHHSDYFYNAPGNTEYLRLTRDIGSGNFNLYASMDDITYNLVQATAPDGTFDFANCGVALVWFSGTVKLEDFDSNILA